MVITKPFVSGRSQAVRIPKEYRLQEEVCISRLGDALLLVPVSKLPDVYMQGVQELSPDFFAEGRTTEYHAEREEL